MRGIRAAFLTGAIIIASSCTHYETPPEQGLLRYTHQPISYKPDHLSHCHGYGCRLYTHVKLTEDDIATLTRFFENVDNAKEERQKISKAVGWLERRTAAQLGIDDIAGTYHRLGDDQHDCVDESVNTSLYLMMMRDMGLIPRHEILSPTSRFPLIGGGIGPHQTAVIRDIETKQEFAVDSWFFDNGYDAQIVDMHEWFYGWKPSGEEKTRHYHEG